VQRHQILISLFIAAMQNTDWKASYHLIICLHQQTTVAENALLKDGGGNWREDPIWQRNQQFVSTVVHVAAQVCELDRQRLRPTQSVRID